MDFSAALPTFVITLREGVEAALVVGIVLALLKKAKASHLNSWVYAGVGCGLVVSALLGAMFGAISKALNVTYPQYAVIIEPVMEGVFSIIAIIMLSWMLLWMTQQARFMKTQVEGAVTSAMKQSHHAGWGVFSLVFIAVLREGFETILFIFAKFQEGIAPALGAFAGIAVATGIAFALFKWGIKINIRRFFQVMGILLLLIVAGLVVSALGHFDSAVKTLSQMDRKSADLCFFYERFVKNPSCILGPRVWDTAKILPDDKFPGLLFSAMFGYTQNLFLVQAVGYVVFLAAIGGAYFRSLTGSPNPAAKKQVSADKKPVNSQKQ
jgi:high-affinity iron transporter